MKSNKVKIISSLLVFFLVVIGGLFYYASTKLRPEEIKKLAIEQTKKVFPRSEVSLGNVQIGWGLNFNINLEKLSVKTTKNNQQFDMMSVDQLLVKIPLWAILTGAGVIEVRLDAPLVTTPIKVDCYSTNDEATSEQH